MFDNNADGQGDERGVAFATGSAHRRRWSAAEKAAIIKETLVPGARVSDVARRCQLDPQQLYRWRHQDGVTQGKTTPRSHAAEPAFVPIVTDGMAVGEVAAAKWANPVIEVRLAGAVVRVVSGSDDAHLTAVLRAVRVSASGS
jgi:transposase